MWNLHGIGGRKFIQMVQAGVKVIYCSSLLSTSVGGGGFQQRFYHKFVPQTRAFSRALKTEKLKAPLFPGTKNDWCIMFEWFSRFGICLVNV